MAKSILHTIESNMGSFSKGQKRIANYILQDYDKAAFMTASKLGKLVGVSESTVVRFASELGYDGYPSMQRALQEMIRSRLTSTQRIQQAGDLFSGKDVLATVIQNDMDKLQMVADEADRAEFDKVVSLLKIWWYGLDPRQIGCHMVIHDYAQTDCFWILYTIAGVGIPLSGYWLYSRIRQQRRFRFRIFL